MVVPPLPAGRMLNLPDRGEIFFRSVDGAGPPVLLLHGWMATADLNWFSAFDALGDGPIVAPDLRGHGRGILPNGAPSLVDCADDAAHLLRALDLDGGAVVVGYSLGVAVSLLLAQRHPELVRGVVLCGGALHWRGAVRQVLIRRAGFDCALQRQTDGRWIAEKLVSRAERETPVTGSWRNWMCAELERGHPGALRSLGRDLGRFDARGWAGALGVPAEVIVTKNDRLVRPKRQHELAAALGATVTEVEADHDAPARSPGVFVPALAAAVGRLRGTGAQAAA